MVQIMIDFYGWKQTVTICTAHGWPFFKMGKTCLFKCLPCLSVREYERLTWCDSLKIKEDRKILKVLMATLNITLLFRHRFALLSSALSCSLTDTTSFITMDSNVTQINVFVLFNKFTDCSKSQYYFLSVNCKLVMSFATQG